MTDEELKELVASLAVEQRETDRQLKETDRKLEKIAKLVGGISENNGYFAEDMFIAALEANPRVANIKFETIIPRANGFTKKGEQREYDAVLLNGTYVGVVEIKYRMHPSDVEKFATTALPEFRKFFPQADDKKIIGAVASSSFPPASLEKAREFGLAVLTTDGQTLKVLSDTIKEY